MTRPYSRVRHARQSLGDRVAKKTIVQNGCGPLDAHDKGTKILAAQPKHQKRTGL
jgi:hypothetical protein